MKSILKRYLRLIFLLVLFLGVSAQLKAQPTNINLSLNEGCRNECQGINVTWYSPHASTPQFIRYGRQENSKNEKLAELQKLDKGFIYKVSLKSLQPSTVYNYQVGSDKTGWSDFKSFKTAPLQGSKSSFKVAVFGDTQNNEFNENFEKTKKIISALTQFNTDLALHYGDIVTPGSRLESWLGFFETAEPLISEVPMMVTIGNHDIVNAEGENFQQPFSTFPTLFSMPENGLDYSFTYGNVHFVFLFSGHAKKAEELGLLRYSIESPEMEWLEQDLAAAKKNHKIDWIIAVTHHPVYSYGWSNVAGWKERIAPVFDKYGVDLCLAGHRHAYERHHPIRNGIPVAANEGTVYITNGTSGGSPQGVGGFDMPTMAYTIPERMYNYAIMTIADSQLTYEVYDIENKKIDEFEIIK